MGTGEFRVGGSSPQRYLYFGENLLENIMEIEIKRAEPVVFLLSDSTHTNAMLEMPTHHFRDEQFGHGSLNPRERPGSSHLVHQHDSCAAQALRRPDASSEPSCSARASLEGDFHSSGGGPPTSMDRRRSVSFQPESLPEEVQRSRSEMLSATVSPFQSYSHLPSDDFTIGLEDHICGPCGYRIGPQGECLGLDKNATSAPLGALDKLDSIPTSFDLNGLHQSSRAGMQTAAQRLIMGQNMVAPPTAPKSRSPFENPSLDQLPQVVHISAPRPRPVRFLSSQLESAPLVMELASVIPPIIPGSPPTHAAPELHRFGESFGAHLISPRVSGDSAGRPPSRASRSSLELLLGASRTSTPTSRHSLDSLQNIIRLVNNGQSWEDPAPSVPIKSVQSPSTGQARFSVASRLANSQLAFETYSVDPLNDLNFDVDQPLALRNLADSATSVTIVAEPLRTAASGAGPSIGAMASAVVDHYSPGVESNPLRKISFGRGSSVLGTTMTPTAAATSPKGIKQSFGGSIGTGYGSHSGYGSYTSRPDFMPALLDADLHDTFGAHAWYCGPGGPHTSPGTTPPSSGGTRLLASTTGEAYDASNAGMNGRHAGARGRAKHLELTSVAGQHSVTLNDSQCIVPSYEFLRQRRLARAKQVLEGEESWSGGYIAEAKRVLSEAMGTASRQEAEQRDSSYSGAIGPLLRHLKAAAGDDDKSRSALHTLSLLVSNLPNRAIIAELEGRDTLAAVLRKCQALDIREQAVAVLWDLDNAAGRDAAPVLGADDLFALLKLLEETKDAAVASHVLHFLTAVVEMPADAGERVTLSAQQLSSLASRVVQEVCAHKHRLHDAAQYTLGSLVGAVLDDNGTTVHDVNAALSSLLTSLAKCTDPGQCQVLLTVLSAMAGRPRLLTAMARGVQARDAVLRCGQRNADPRLRARALSLIKVLNKEEHAAATHSWYFGPENSGH